MALSVNFSTTQSRGTPSKITFTDLSTGVDAAVVSRRITLTDYNGDTYVQDGTTTTYEVWSGFPGTTSIILTILTILNQDRAFLIKVDWINISGTVLYTKTILTLCPIYLKDYYINLIKSQSSNRKLIDHANFYQNEIKLLCSIQEATTAVSEITDIASAQAALDRGKKLIDNQSNFY